MGGSIWPRYRCPVFFIWNPASLFSRTTTCSYSRSYLYGSWRCPGVSLSNCAWRATSASWSCRPRAAPAWPPASSRRPVGTLPSCPHRCRSPRPWLTGVVYVFIYMFAVQRCDGFSCGAAEVSHPTCKSLNAFRRHQSNCNNNVGIAVDTRAKMRRFTYFSGIWERDRKKGKTGDRESGTDRRRGRDRWRRMVRSCPLYAQVVDRSGC